MYFSQVSINKMIQLGTVQTINIPVSGDGRTDFDEFKTVLKQYQPNELNRNLLEEYRNIHLQAMPLFGISKTTKLSYQEIVDLVYEDSSFILREDYNFELAKEFDYASKFILSYAAVELLFIMGVKVSDFQKGNVFVPKSLINELQDEKDSIMRDYSDNAVGTIGVIDDQFVFNQKSDELKKKQMRFALNFLDYCKDIPQIENSNNVECLQLSENDVLNLYGVVDYDALAIAKNEGMVLVSMESFLSGISFLYRQEDRSCNMIEFLFNQVQDIRLLINCMTKMVGFRVINVINSAVLKKILFGTHEDLQDEWIRFLNEVDKTEDDYRELLKIELTISGRSVLAEDDNDVIINNQYRSNYMSLLMKLNSLKIAYRIKDGILEYAIYQEAYDN